MDEWVAKTEGRRWSTEGYHRAQRWLGHGPRLLVCCGADQRLGPSRTHRIVMAGMDFRGLTGHPARDYGSQGRMPQLTRVKPLSRPERRHPDKEEVPGSSPGTPTDQHPVASGRFSPESGCEPARPWAGQDRCRLPGRWGSSSRRICRRPAETPRCRIPGACRRSRSKRDTDAQRVRLHQLLGAVQGELQRAGCVFAGERGFRGGSGCGGVACDDTVSVSDMGRPSSLSFAEVRGEGREVLGGTIAHGRQQRGRCGGASR